VILATLLGLTAAATRQSSAAEGVARGPGSELRFTENKGQWNAKAKFLAQTKQVDFWVTGTGLVYNWHGADKTYAVGVEFVGATGLGQAKGIKPRPGHTNYYLGARKATNVRSFAEATIQDLYKGIDLVTYFDAQEHRPRYDLVVHPGADPNQIKMRFTNAKNLAVTKEGSVQYDTPFGKIEEQRQMAYQKADAGPDFHFFPAQVKNPDGTVGFDTRGYLKDRTLVIDPIVYATYIGGSTSDSVTAIKADANGNVYVGGTTSDSDFPVLTSATVYATINSFTNAFAAKFGPDGTCLFTTLYGGSSNEAATNVGFDASGNTYLAGSTLSSDLHLSTTTIPAVPTSKLFVAKFDTLGALSYALKPSTFSDRTPYAFAVNPDGSAAFAATVFKNDNSAGSFQGHYEIYCDTIDPSGVLGNLPFSYALTTVSSNASDDTNIALTMDASGNIYVAAPSSLQSGSPLAGGYQVNAGSGENIVVVKFTGTSGNNGPAPNGTYFGGSNFVVPTGIAVDSSGNVFVSGHPSIGQFNAPATGVNYGASGFVAKFSNDLGGLEALGKLNTDVTSVTTDANGCPILFGQGAAPLTWDAFSGHYGGTYIQRLSADLATNLYCTYLGDTSAPINCLDLGANGYFYAGGVSNGDLVITTAGAFQTTYPGGSSSGYFEILNPAPPAPGLTRITSNRGAAPSLAGGVGKQVTVSVYFNEPDSANITLSSSDPKVQINGSASASVATNDQTVAGATHVATFAITASDVATPQTFTLTATDGTSTLTIPVTVQPFVRVEVLRPGAVTPGQPLTVYVTPYEVPATDQTINISASTPSDLVGTPSLTIKGIASGQQISGATTTTVTIGDFAASHVGTINASLAGGSSSASSSLQFKAAGFSMLTFDQPAVNSEGSSNLTLTMTATRPLDQTYTLTSNNLAVAGSVDILIPANTLTGTSPVTIGTVFSTALTASVTFSTALNGATKSTALKVTTNHLVSVDPTSAVVVEGDSFSLLGTLLLPSSNAPAFTWVSTYPDSIPSGVLTATPGTTGLSGVVQTKSVALTASRSARLTVQTAGGAAKFVTVTILPLLTSIAMPNVGVQGGTDITGTVTLAEPNNTTTSSFSIMSSSPLAYFDATAPSTVSTGTNTSIPFAIHTLPVTKPTKVVITLPTPLGYRTKQFNVTLYPGSPP